MNKQQLTRIISRKEVLTYHEDGKHPTELMLFVNSAVEGSIALSQLLRSQNEADQQTARKLLPVVVESATTEFWAIRKTATAFLNAKAVEASKKAADQHAKRMSEAMDADTADRLVAQAVSRYGREGAIAFFKEIAQSVKEYGWADSIRAAWARNFKTKTNTQHAQD